MISLFYEIIHEPFKCYVTQWVVSAFPEKSATKVYGSTLLVLRGGGWGQFSRKKHYVTLEWPLIR